MTTLLKQLFVGTFRLLKNILFSTTCFYCKKEPLALHKHCLQKLPDYPIEKHNNENIPSFIPWIFPILQYKNAATKELIRYLKNFEDREQFEICSQLMHSRMKPYLREYVLVQDIRNVYISCIPSSKKRLEKYDYNQGKLLAKMFSKHHPSYIFTPKLLKRKREVSKQSLLKNKKERLENMKDVFEINTKNKNRISRKDLIIIIDDVYTTGATLVGARDALLEKTEHVLGVVLAH